MKVKIKRKKHFKISYFIILITIILLFVGTSYSLLSTTLYINGKIDGNFNYSLVPQVTSGNNYSSNTGFSTKLWFFSNVELFEFVKDVKENEMLTTQIKNNEKSWNNTTKNTTFTITLKNNSPLRLTNGTVEVTDDNSGQYMSPSGNPTLGSTTLESNGTTTVKVTISFGTNNNVPANSYITYTIKYKYNNVNISYKYKVLVIS